MAYYRFSTDQANYVFEGVNHVWARHNHKVFQGIDALVVETGKHSHKLTAENYSPLSPEVICSTSRFGGSRLIRQVKDEHVPVFSVDVAMEHVNVHGDFPQQLVKDLVFLSLSNGLISERIIDYVTSINHKNQLPILAGRSAINAYKIEALAKRIEHRKRKRPFIALRYGILHVDMVRYLTNPPLREEVLEAQRGRDFEGIDKETLKRFVELNYLPPVNSWSIKFGQLNLF